MAEDTMTPELLAFVKEQKDRHEIKEALLRYARGVDRHDKELMASAYHADSWDDHGMKSAPGPEFCDWAIALHHDLQTKHQHYMLNHSVELDGDVAHAETYYFFWGENRAGPPMLAFGRYIDRFEKRDGKWAIAYQRCITEKTGKFIADDLSPELQALNDSAGPSRRDRQDISYARPLTRDTPDFPLARRLDEKTA
jgi:ketosteroid isomerase-like protein